jgi:hypothetical protein
MAAIEKGPWFPLGPQPFVDRRVRLTREHGLVHQNVRAFRGVVVNKENRETEKCPHAHQKARAARGCAEAAAKRLNKAGATTIEDMEP